MKSLHNSAYRSQIANLAVCHPASTIAGATPLWFRATLRAGFDPRGAIRRQVFLPLPVRPFLIFKAKAVWA